MAQGGGGMSPDQPIGYLGIEEQPPPLPLWRRWTRRTVVVHSGDLVEVGRRHPATVFADVEADYDWVRQVQP